MNFVILIWNVRKGIKLVKVRHEYDVNERISLSRYFLKHGNADLKVLLI